MQITLDLNSITDYRKFLAIKRLPAYSIRGRVAEFPDEYAATIGAAAVAPQPLDYSPSSFLFDYQTGISQIAIRKRKFAVFADCGLGKSLIFLEFARAASEDLGSSRGVLIVSPLMVVSQTLEECRRFYGDKLPVEQVKAGDLSVWIKGCGGKIGITNYEAISEGLTVGQLGALILDESSMLKSHYGAWGQRLLELGRGLHWKLSLTGTPAPNDRIEYANQAVFLDAFPTVNSFLAKFFVNRGQTSERWEIKPHALRPFYRALSHWCIFISNPGTYGWKDNSAPLPPIHIHQHHVDLTPEQVAAIGKQSGQLFATDMGGITSRSVMGSLAKGMFRGERIATNKPEFIRDQLINTWPEESTLIWCKYNHEQELIGEFLPEAASITGTTPLAARTKMINDFKAGAQRVLISKPKILGYGLNLQRATRQVFSGLEDSYEAFYQCIKRSNRYGSTRDLNVHLPLTDIEVPMIETVLKKMDRVQADTAEQEEMFRSECDHLLGAA